MLKQIRNLLLFVFVGLIILSGCRRDEQLEIEFLEELGEEVESLFNSKGNDLHMNLSMDHLDEVGEKVSEGQAKKLSKENQKRLDVLEEDYTDALEMFVLEEEIEGLFEEGKVLITTFDLGDIEKAENAYEDFDLKKYNEYDNRVGKDLTEAREQANQIMLVEDLFLEIFDDEGMVRADIDVEAEKEKLAAEIGKIKNSVFREDYGKWLAKLDEEEVIEEPEEEEEEIDLEDEVDSESEEEDTGNFSGSNNSNTGGNNNSWNSGNSNQGSGGSSSEGSSGGSSGSSDSGNSGGGSNNGSSGSGGNSTGSDGGNDDDPSDNDTDNGNTDDEDNNNGGSDDDSNTDNSEEDTGSGEDDSDSENQADDDEE